MRLSLTSAAIAACALGASALPAAAAGNYGVAYLGLRGSYIVTEDGSTIGAPGVVLYNFDYDQTYENGYGTSAFIGWTVANDFRIELEGGFRSADLDTATVITGDGVTYLGGETVDIGSDVQMGTAMVNFYYDLDLDAWLVPYIGAGAGAAHIEYNVTEPGLIFSGNDKAWIFAYQLMAGVSFPIADGFSMSLGYRYFMTEDFDRTGTTGQVFKTDITQHSLDVGMQFSL
jgi:opacity protein-like surface antigen